MSHCRCAPEESESTAARATTIAAPQIEISHQSLCSNSVALGASSLYLRRHGSQAQAYPLPRAPALFVGHPPRDTLNTLRHRPAVIATHSLAVSP